MTTAPRPARRRRPFPWHLVVFLGPAGALYSAVMVVSPLPSLRPMPVCARCGSCQFARFFAPWLGREGPALIVVGLMSVWQYVGIPMLLFSAALLAIPDEIIEAARVDGAGAWRIFRGIQLPMIAPTIGVVAILTFVGNFNAFDLIYAVQGGLAGPEFSTDIMGTFFYRTFFGFQLQLGSPTLGATVAGMMFLIILFGVCLYLFGVQRRLATYQA